MSDSLPKFEEGQFVKRIKKGDIVEISDVSEEHKSYFINYVGIDLKKDTFLSGGSSGWWSEEEFEEITDATTLLFLEKHRLLKVNGKLQQEMNNNNRAVDHLNYALRFINQNNGGNKQ